MQYQRITKPETLPGAKQAAKLYEVINTELYPRLGLVVIGFVYMFFPRSHRVLFAGFLLAMGIATHLAACLGLDMKDKRYCNTQTDCLRGYFCNTQQICERGSDIILDAGFRDRAEMTDTARDTDSDASTRDQTEHSDTSQSDQRRNDANVVDSIETDAAVGIDCDFHVTAPVPGRRLALGNLFTCALTNSDGVMCWGKNTYGELGIGYTGVSSPPMHVVGLSTGIKSVATGLEHTCALTTSGQVKCWGSNFYKAVGAGANPWQNTPYDVELPQAAIEVSAGYHFSCALLQDGSVRCWGSNDSCQLGTYSGNTSTPVTVNNINNATFLASGVRHSCVLTLTGAVMCWGDNSDMQLGNGTLAEPCSPVSALNLGGTAVRVSAGAAHSCALLDNGMVRCWGSNDNGALGVADDETHAAVTPVGLTCGVTQVSTGNVHSCALKQQVHCWGLNNSGQLGDSTYNHHYIPAPASLSGNVVDLNAGYLHSCARLDDGTLWCWGSNSSGQLGDGTQTRSPVPVKVIGFGD